MKGLKWFVGLFLFAIFLMANMFLWPQITVAFWVLAPTLLGAGIVIVVLYVFKNLISGSFFWKVASAILGVFGISAFVLILGIGAQNSGLTTKYVEGEPIPMADGFHNITMQLNPFYFDLTDETQMHSCQYHEEYNKKLPRYNAGEISGKSLLSAWVSFSREEGNRLHVRGSDGGEIRYGIPCLLEDGRKLPRGRKGVLFIQGDFESVCIRDGNCVPISFEGYEASHAQGFSATLVPMLRTSTPLPTALPLGPTPTSTPTPVATGVVAQMTAVPQVAEGEFFALEDFVPELVPLWELPTCSGKELSPYPYGVLNCPFSVGMESPYMGEGTSRMGRYWAWDVLGEYYPLVCIPEEGSTVEIIHCADDKGVFVWDGHTPFLERIAPP
jgi:hypothetical protein